jgi:hypothetical protein
MSRESYLTLLRETDPRIASLLDQGFRFVTNAFRPGEAPSGLPVKDTEQVAAQLRREGWEVEIATAYDERGQPLPRMAALWRRGPDR